MRIDNGNTKHSRQTIFNKPYQPGLDSEMDAWFTVFFIENHLDHFTHPDQAAAPEQIRFMVYTEDDERYYPCSDRMFAAIMNRNESDFIQGKYQEVLERILKLIDGQIKDQSEKDYLKALIKIKYRHETRDEIMIPSRLEKRLIRIFLNHTQISDPYIIEKAGRNRRVSRILNSEEFKEALNYFNGADLTDSPSSLAEIKALVEDLELKRQVFRIQFSNSAVFYPIFNLVIRERRHPPPLKEYYPVGYHFDSRVLLPILPLPVPTVHPALNIDQTAFC